jgi:hypothetical protein
MKTDFGLSEIARRLAARAVELVFDLLPAGYREGAEWRCGSVAGERGDSLGVHLTGAKAGVWSDFSTGQKGDALDLVREVLGLNMRDAIRWSLRWLGLEDGEASSPDPPAASRTPEAKRGSDYWRKAFSAARSISETIAETYLVETRKLKPPGPMIEVLRFAPRHPRRTGEMIEHHPALLALLSDIHTARPCGTINIYLRPDGSDRLRDKKGKTSWGRVADSAVMLSPFDDVTMGLIICEGVETGLALLMHNLAPVWCCGGSGNLKQFPILGGIEALTVAADADEPGQKAAAEVIRRWRSVGRESVAVAPPDGDWADQAKQRQVS